MGLARPRKRVTRLGVLALLLMVGGLTPGAGSGAGAGAVQPVPPDDPGRGMVWRGLAPGRAENRCQGAYEVTGPAGQVLGCTHGPDPAPAGTDVRRARTTGDMAAAAAALPAPTAGPGTNGNGLPCIGDGSSGYRMEAIYAIAGPSSTRPDRYDQLAPVIRSSYAPYVEWQYRTTASENGAAAHVPFVTTPDASGCALVVRHEVLTAAGDDSFSNTISELKARGYNRTDRRYMVWMDANVLCGIGQIYRDNQPGQANANNGYYTAFGRSDAGCWGYSEGHELMQTWAACSPRRPTGPRGSTAGTRTTRCATTTMARARWGCSRCAPGATAGCSTATTTTTSTPARRPLDRGCRPTGTPTTAASSSGRRSPPAGTWRRSSTPVPTVPCR
jgi:hypothetical protein